MRKMVSVLWSDGVAICFNRFTGFVVNKNLSSVVLNKAWRSFMHFRVVVVLLFLLVMKRSSAQTPPAHIVRGIDSLFRIHVSQFEGVVPGHVIRIEKPGNWVYENSSGFSSVNPAISMQADKKFKVASITKLFTAVAIFKLIQDGLVDFNAPISSYLPLSVVNKFKNYQDIKVRSLLSHTSGITDPQNDFQGRLNYWIYMRRFDSIPVDSLISWSYKNPGGVGNYSYSNSNFYLLAEIVRNVTGGSYHSYVINNIINPLGLANTDFNTVPSGNFMRGYLRGSFYGKDIVLPENVGLEPDSLYDFTEASNSWGYGAAEIWSNTIDLIKFQRALFEGRLIRSSWLDTMKKVVASVGDMSSYGHGMSHFKSSNGGAVFSYGHTGSAFGYGSILAYIPDLNVYISAASNYSKVGQEFLQREIYKLLTGNMAGIEDTEGYNSVVVYPNPATDVLYVKSASGNFKASVFDVTGELVMSDLRTEVIDVSDLPRGLYVLKYYDLDSHRSFVQKFICE